MTFTKVSPQQQVGISHPSPTPFEEHHLTENRIKDGEPLSIEKMGE